MMNNLSKSDLVEGLPVIINPDMSPNGKYGDYLGETGVIHKISKYYSYSEPSIYVKMNSDGHIFRDVGMQSILPAPEAEKVLSELLIDSFNKKKEQKEEEKSKVEKEIEGIELKITYIKETSAHQFSNQDYKKWLIKRIVNNEDLTSDEKEELIEDLI